MHSPEGAAGLPDGHEATTRWPPRFPELYRALALAGAQILTVPANFTERTGRDHWEVLLRARAIENGAFVLAPAQIGGPPGQLAFGRSMTWTASPPYGGRSRSSRTAGRRRMRRTRDRTGSPAEAFRPVPRVPSPPGRLAWLVRVSDRHSRRFLISCHRPVKQERRDGVAAPMENQVVRLLI